MRLISLDLYNFRPFYGQTTSIQFAQLEQRNVTVIIGNNGCGKTAILNAMTWLLYEKFTDALDHPEHLVCRRAISEAQVDDKVQCWVQLLFEHQGRKYRFKRLREVRKIDNEGNYEITQNAGILESAAADGRWKGIDEISPTINRILPEDLHRYFFFDGERIENLQRPDKKKEIASATTKLNGEEILTRAINHLDSARSYFEAELRRIGDVEIKGLLAEKQRLEENRDELLQEIKLHDDNINGLGIEKAQVEECLRSLKEVEDLQKRRDELNDLRKHYEESQTSTRQELANLISSQGFKAFLRKAIDRFQRMTQDLKSAGELPSAIKSPFVQGLLEQQRCICGRELLPGEIPYLEVERWRERCGLSEVETVIFRMEGEVEQVSIEIPDFFARLDQLQKNRMSLREKISNIDADLADIKEQLRESPEEEARTLQDRLDELDKLMDKERDDRAIAQVKLRPLFEKIKEKEKQIDKRQGLNAQQELVRRRRHACITAKEQIEEVRKRLRASFRKDLAERISRVFSNISFKPYIPILTEDYNLQLMENSQSRIPVGASTAENQVLSLAFIGGIIEQAKEFTARRDFLPGPDSSVFPMVMDAAFGNLDPIYRTQVARRIPELANQVIILVNKSQWQNEVATMTGHRIGKQFVISYEGPKKGAEDVVEIGGQVYSLVQYRPEEEESSQIVEVKLHGQN